MWIEDWLFDLVIVEVISDFDKVILEEGWGKI